MPVALGGGVPRPSLWIWRIHKNSQGAGSWELKGLVFTASSLLARVGGSLGSLPILTAPNPSCPTLSPGTAWNRLSQGSWVLSLAPLLCPAPHLEELCGRDRGDWGRLTNYVTGIEGWREWVIPLHPYLGPAILWLTSSSVTSKHPIDVQAGYLLRPGGNHGQKVPFSPQCPNQ